MSDWTVIVGLEIHAELMTKSKMFSACPVVDSVTAPPNTAVDPVSLGLPGTLPVINAEAVEMALMVGLALHCEIPPVNQFARKSYFYPDLPKGYQISQYDRPICINGYLDVELSDGSTQRIRVRRAHLEEDTGKSIHIDGASLIDLNRAGVPLLEIVTEPDIHSAEAAEAFARKLRAILQYLGVNNGDMSKGVMRVEPNISVQHKDDTGYRTRTEVKNLNSIRSLFRSIEYETERQVKAWESQSGVRQATLGWDEAKQRTVVQRYKESADEYRYFPEPDLPILEVSRAWVEAVRANLPELPDAKRDRFVSLGLTAYDASVLVAEKAVASYFEAVIGAGANPKSAANWIIGNLFSLSNRDGIEREAVGERVSAQNMAELVKMVSDGTLNKATGVEVLTEMWETGRNPVSIVEVKGLAQVSDTSAVETAAAKVMTENDKMVQDYLGGKDKLFGPLMGKVMAELKGQGNPAV
ncbi:MAG TPA: Asp-tRNA(Asn)/Glu-tRNA(Gln) amidotransferase subunit GatB, partial [Phototrophicaceae bacterium]|nr:Asp-tRNA(Asn)/Glu-tRNA(Gln) amidotransferase subunit GatB [Phototrophicaceae bacterium]